MCQDIQLYTRHALDSTPRAAPKTSMAIRGGQGLALLTKCRSKSKCRTLDGECVSDCTVSIAEGRSVASWLCCLALASTVACLLGGSNASLTAAGFAESPANVPDWAALALGGWTRGETLATACGSAAVTVGVACWWRGSLAREPPGNAVSVMALCTARTLTERRPPYSLAVLPPPSVLLRLPIAVRGGRQAPIPIPWVLRILQSQVRSRSDQALSTLSADAARAESSLAVRRATAAGAIFALLYSKATVAMAYSPDVSDMLRILLSLSVLSAVDFPVRRPAVNLSMQSTTCQGSIFRLRLGR
jgi:hypothetical protein